ncbi:hypothetical protein D3C85_833160 [compost metagenome]
MAPGSGSPFAPVTLPLIVFCTVSKTFVLIVFVNSEIDRFGLVPLTPLVGVLFNFKEKFVSFDSVAAETCNVTANRNPDVNLVTFQISEVSHSFVGLSLINNFIFVMVLIYIIWLINIEQIKYEINTSLYYTILLQRKRTN